ncbi:hypothetical protein [Geotalea uraniireducens]|uniref:hypothetical protein n=1 Tax=Geotalea uraniireducens TaxID=351604 RepID=UPI0012ED09C2|nr:hypothetical protein [Geotalea uraniireducens]
MKNINTDFATEPQRHGGKAQSEAVEPQITPKTPGTRRKAKQNSKPDGTQKNRKRPIKLKTRTPKLLFKVLKSAFSDFSAFSAFYWFKVFSVPLCLCVSVAEVRFRNVY